MIHRLSQEPSRLARRYLIEDLPFAASCSVACFGLALRACSRRAAAKSFHSGRPRASARCKVTRMKILVTGGAGFIGSHVADALLASGHEILILDDLSTGRRTNVPARASFVQGDIRDAEVVAKVFADFRPQVVTHQAAQTSVAVSTREPLRDAQINVLGTSTSCSRRSSTLEKLVCEHRRRDLRRGSGR